MTEITISIDIKESSESLTQGKRAEAENFLLSLYLSVGVVGQSRNNFWQRSYCFPGTPKLAKIHRPCDKAMGNNGKERFLR
jgi:hypothetical protein